MTEAPALPDHLPLAAEADSPEPATTPAKAPTVGLQLFNRMDGTWYRPAPFSRVIPFVEFWNTVEIPEGVVERFFDAYFADREKKIADALNDALVDWRDVWMAENPKPKREKDHPEWGKRLEEAWAQRKGEILPGLRGQYPDIHDYDMPILARATQMMRYRPTGEYGDIGDLILDEWVELYTETLRLTAVEEKYGLFQFRKVLSERPTGAVVAAIQDVNSAISALHNEVNAARGTLIDMYQAMP